MKRGSLHTEGGDGVDLCSDMRSIQGGDDHAGGEEEDELNDVEEQHLSVFQDSALFLDILFYFG